MYATPRAKTAIELSLVRNGTHAYRVQLQRIEGANKNAIDAPQLEEDLARLRKWEAEEVSSELQNMNRRA